MTVLAKVHDVARKSGGRLHIVSVLPVLAAEQNPLHVIKLRHSRWREAEDSSAVIIVRGTNDMCVSRAGSFV